MLCIEYSQLFQGDVFASINKNDIFEVALICLTELFCFIVAWARRVVFALDEYKNSKPTAQ